METSSSTPNTTVRARHLVAKIDETLSKADNEQLFRQIFEELANSDLKDFEISEDQEDKEEFISCFGKLVECCANRPSLLPQEDLDRLRVVVILQWFERVCNT